MTIVVVKKLIQTKKVLMQLLVMLLGLVVNVLVTCRENGMMPTVLYTVVVIKVTKYSTGVYSTITLLNIDVELLVSISTLVLLLATYKTS
jgi:hypothetical protein